jgi:hypothetical protein
MSMIRKKLIPKLVFHRKLVQGNQIVIASLSCL